jgi:DNA-binding NtrC family response regulator
MRAAMMGRRDEPEGAGPMAELVSVLVVDDEEIVLKSVKRILKNDDEHEFLVDTATSAAEGLGRADQTDYDIIVADLMMPGIDGLEFIERIRRTNTRSKIIMITGHATMDSSLRALRKGAFEYLAKPFTMKELRSIVKNAARSLGE